MRDNQVKNDSLHLLLSNACNRGCSNKVRAASIRRCAKLISARTKDKDFKRACLIFRKTKDDFSLIEAIESRERKYGVGW